MIYQVFRYARAYDAGFAGSAPPAGDLAELRRIWSLPELPNIAAAAPIATWDQIEKGVASLAALEADDLPADWIALVGHLENLSDHPVAAAIGLTYALAALESVSKGDFYWSLADGARPEWHPVGLVFAQTLIRLRAIWSAELYIRKALDTIQATNRYRNDRQQDIRERAAKYADLSSEVHTLRRYAVEELSSDLVARHAELSGGLAALLWTLGQPIDAEGVAAGDKPSRWIIETIIDDSLRRGDWDPLTQDTWAAVDDRFDFDLQQYPLLSGKLTQHVAPTPTRRIDLGSNPPLSRTYALTAVAHYQDELTDEMKKQFEFVCENWISVLMPTQSSDAIRILAFHALVLSPPTERADRMAELARTAATLIERARALGVNDYYDHSFDGIFGHLAVQPDEQLERTLDLIEIYRMSGLAYWLVMTRPALPDQNEARELLDKEEELLEEIRGARFVRLSPELPRHYQKYTINADHWESFGNPFDQERAVNRLQQLVDQLVNLWSELDEIAPDYARERRAPTPSIDEFALLLNPRGEPVQENAG